MIDDVVEEPLGGAHWDPEAVAQRLKASIIQFFTLADGMTMEALLDRRYERFRRLGVYASTPPA
jgi:acetyl-CoA carboxylase carboxyl transferase subunit alpha